MLQNTGAQLPETRMDVLCGGLEIQLKTNAEWLTRLDKIVGRVEEQPPAEGPQSCMPTKPQQFGPGHLYRLNDIGESLARQNDWFDRLLSRLEARI